jgi:hypothetical protein
MGKPNRVSDIRTYQATRLPADWDTFCKWLKERTYRMNKELLAAAKLNEIREHNDKILRQAGLGKYQRKGDY